MDFQSMADQYLFPILRKFNRLEWRSDDPNLGSCQCPAHADDKNSLHVTLNYYEGGKVRLFLHCHAGCNTGEIVRAVNEGMSSLYPDRSLIRKESLAPKVQQAQSQTAEKVRESAANAAAPQNHPHSPAVSPTDDSKKRKFVCAYDYRDESGVIQHQTIRYEPKGFMQRRRVYSPAPVTIGNKEYKPHRDPHGNLWISTLTGIEPLIYDLPRILKAPKDKIIFFFEGEKDADNAKKKFGIYATTVPMGSGKWRKSYCRYFAGRRVIIIPDTDKPRIGHSDPAANPGYDGARKIAGELVEIASEVRICYLPNLFNFSPKWDVTNWIEAGGTKDQFFDACRAAEILTPGHPGLIPAGNNPPPIVETPLPPSAVTSETDSEPWDGSFDLSIPPTTPTPNESILLDSPVGKGNPSAGDTVRLDEFNKPIRGLITNVYETAEDGFKALSMSAITHNIFKTLNGWPKRVGKNLFFVDHEKDAEIDPNFFPIRWFKKPASLFAWMGSYSGQSPLFIGQGSHPKDEVFDELQYSAEKFDAVEDYPHEPRVQSVYYACKEPQKWVSKKPGILYDFIARFEPAEDVDADLIISFLMTLLWGGRGGKRPMFVIVSDSGRGAGKTTFAELCSSLVGGAVKIDSHQDSKVIYERLLSPEGIGKRVVLMDNIKSHKFSWPEMEALITSETISGKEMYVGEASRTNMITYVLTMNAPSFSTDMAQRSVVIKLGRPNHDGKWLEDTYRMLDEHKVDIISELLALLRGPQLVVMDKASRFADWEKNVLCKLSTAEKCQEMIRRRVGNLDSEQDDCELIMEYFEKQLIKNGIRADYDKVFIPSMIAGDWHNAALGERNSISAGIKSIKQKIDEGKLNQLFKNGTDGKKQEQLDGSSSRSRGFWWIPEKYSERESQEFRPGGLEKFEVKDMVLF